MNCVNVTYTENIISLSEITELRKDEILSSHPPCDISLLKAKASLKVTYGRVVRAGISVA